MTVEHRPRRHPKHAFQRGDTFLVQHEDHRRRVRSLETEPRGKSHQWAAEVEHAWPITEHLLRGSPYKVPMGAVSSWLWAKEQGQVGNKFDVLAPAFQSAYTADFHRAFRVLRERMKVIPWIGNYGALVQPGAVVSTTRRANGDLWMSSGGTPGPDNSKFIVWGGPRGAIALPVVLPGGPVFHTHDHSGEPFFCPPWPGYPDSSLRPPDWVFSLKRCFFCDGEESNEMGYYTTTGERLQPIIKGNVTDSLLGSHKAFVDAYYLDGSGGGWHQYVYDGIPDDCEQCGGGGLHLPYMMKNKIASETWRGFDIAPGEDGLWYTHPHNVTIRDSTGLYGHWFPTDNLKSRGPVRDWQGATDEPPVAAFAPWSAYYTKPFTAPTLASVHDSVVNDLMTHGNEDLIEWYYEKLGEIAEADFYEHEWRDFGAANVSSAGWWESPGSGNCQGVRRHGLVFVRGWMKFGPVHGGSFAYPSGADSWRPVALSEGQETHALQGWWKNPATGEILPSRVVASNNSISCARTHGAAQEWVRFSGVYPHV